MFLFNIILLDVEDRTGIYCNRDMTDLFAPILSGTGVYCSRTLTGLFADPITGTGVYCSQDMSQF
jgi:hypothetical protein